jgi:hypothetical protein
VLLPSNAQHHSLQQTPHHLLLSELPLLLQQPPALLKSLHCGVLQCAARLLGASALEHLLPPAALLIHLLQRLWLALLLPAAVQQPWLPARECGCVWLLGTGC